jgi:CHAD domain-containing protein
MRVSLRQVALEAYPDATPPLRRPAAVSYDSPDLRLLRWGVSLRYRPEGVWTVKLPEFDRKHGKFRNDHTFAGEAGVVPPAALDLVAAVLRGVRPEPMPNVRGAGKRAPEPELAVPSLDRDARASAVVTAALAAGVHRVVRLDPLLRVEPTIERIHDARVTVRRLRSHLRTFRPLLHGPWADQLRERLRWLNDVLSGARDADVLIADITKRALAMPGQRRHVDALLEPYRKQRDDAYAAVEAVLRSPRYTSLIDALIGAARAPQFMLPAYGRARPLVDELMDPMWKRLRRRVRRAGQAPHDHDLHGIRIKAKHVRYAAEALEPIVGRPARTFAKRVEALQKVLGEQHDAVVAYRALNERPHTPRCAFLAGEIAAAEQAVATDRRQRWHRGYEELCAKKMRFW